MMLSCLHSLLCCYKRTFPTQLLIKNINSMFNFMKKKVQNQNHCIWWEYSGTTIMWVRYNLSTLLYYLWPMPSGKYKAIWPHNLHIGFKLLCFYRIGTQTNFFLKICYSYMSVLKFCPLTLTKIKLSEVTLLLRVSTALAEDLAMCYFVSSSFDENPEIPLEPIVSSVFKQKFEYWSYFEKFLYFKKHIFIYIIQNYHKFIRQRENNSLRNRSRHLVSLWLIFIFSHHHLLKYLFFYILL